MSNAINPEHYNRLNPKPKDVIRAWGLNFNLGSAVKYISRAGHKDDIVQDLKKAQEFIQFEIDAIEAEREKSTKPKAPEHINCMCDLKMPKSRNPKGDGLDALKYGIQEMLDSVAKMEELSVKPIVVKLPEGEDPEEIFKGLKRSKPVVEKAESAGSGDIYISLGNLAGMKPQSFREKYIKPKKVADLVVTAGSKRYYVDTVESDVTDGVRGVFLTMTIKLKDKHSGGSVTIILKG